MWWPHLCTRPGERRWGAVGENDFLRHYHQSPDRSGPPILPWGRTRREGGWGRRIRLEGTRTDLQQNRLLTISSSHLLTVLCPPFLCLYLSNHIFICFYFPWLHKTAARAFRNGPCWSESSAWLNCIINYSTGSGLEANLKRGREIEREQELDDEMEDSCPTPPVGLCLSLPCCKWRMGEGRGLGYLGKRSCYIPEKGRLGVGGGSTSCWKEHRRLSTAFEPGSHRALR